MKGEHTRGELEGLKTESGVKAKLTSVRDECNEHTWMD